MAEYYEFTVSDENAGGRLDKFLCECLPKFSRNELRRFDVTHNGAPAKFAVRVRAGDAITVSVPDGPARVAIGNASHDFDLDILFEDEDIIVVNKPRGVVIYPSAGNMTGTMVQNLLSHTYLSLFGGMIRPGVVHRLDKDTSGVMVFAKSDAAYRQLVKVFADHDLTRKYVAMVWGIPNWEEATITGNIARSSRNRQKMSMVKTGGKFAHTDVAVMNAYPRAGASMFRCTLLTGRTHQIRVHLSSHGFPIICDPLYGRGAVRLGSVKDPDLLRFIKTHHGQMLHAEVLGCTPRHRRYDAFQSTIAR